MIRSVVASVAARLDFLFDEIEDLCLAVDEACAAVLEAPSPGETLTVRIAPSPDRPTIVVEVAGDGPVDGWPPAGFPGSLTWQVLDALTDRFEPVAGPAGPLLRLVKTGVRR